jgi:hypothetical protein
MLDTWKTVGDPFERNIWRDDFRSGSNSEVELADADFRFTPESRHPAAGLECPFRATSGLMRRSKQRHYSITSSA